MGGALLGLTASGILVGGKGFEHLDAEQLTGFALAVGCAFVWASYSVLSRRLAEVPSESVALPCLATAVLAFASSLVFEEWTSVVDRQTWIALLLLGLGPVGGAFMLWDIGMKKGNIPLLGVLAYASPVISTGLLVALGLAMANWSLLIACGLIVAAAAISGDRQ